MKKLIKLTGIIALAVIIGFAMISCDEVKETIKEELKNEFFKDFEGTWLGTITDNITKKEYDDAKLVFTETTWTLTSPSLKINESGTYEADGSTGAMVANLKNSNGAVVYTAALFTNSLSITGVVNNGSSSVSGNFNPEGSRNVDFTGTWTGSITDGDKIYEDATIEFKDVNTGTWTLKYNENKSNYSGTYTIDLLKRAVLKITVDDGKEESFGSAYLSNNLLILTMGYANTGDSGSFTKK